MRRVAKLAPLALAAASALAGIGASEVIVRRFFPGDAPLFLDIYRIDEAGLLGMRPDVVRRHLAREWDVTVAINHEGLRDDRLPADGSGGTVLALGDSFAFGWGVELEDTFLALTEDALSDASIRIVKAGIPGTGTTDQLAWLEAHGDDYAPRTVVQTFFVGNDFVDVQKGGVAGQFVVSDGLMVRRTADGQKTGAAGRAKELVLRHSLLAQRLVHAAWAIRRTRPATDNPGLQSGDAWLGEFFNIHRRRLPPDSQRGVTETLACLTAMRDRCASRGTRLILVAIPRSFQVYPSELPSWQRAFSVTDAELDLDQPQHVLQTWATGAGVTFVDLLEPFRAEAARPGRPRLFFHPDAHMSAAGHRLAAAVLASALRSRR